MDDTHLLDLLKLVHAENAGCVSAVAADLLAEARAPACVADGEVLGVHPQVAVERAQGLLRGGDEVLLVHGRVVLVLTAMGVVFVYTCVRVCVRLE